MKSLVREKNPLVINITNYVTINDIANILTTIGASPIMTHEIEEAEELLNICKFTGGALVVNIGTINKLQREQILKAVKIANELDIKVILDPVGAGASEYRTSICMELLTNFKIDIIRGNFSEISALYGNAEVTRGVDGRESNDEDLAYNFARKFDVVTVISGKDDYIANEDQTLKIENRGSSYLPKISGTGCMLTSIVGAYAAVYDNFEAAKLALTHMLDSSEKAEVNASSIIEFRFNLFKEMEHYEL